jgi:intracellular multiplication protein IcmB
MYMLAGYALTKDYRLDQPTVESMRMPSQYLDYHMERMREIQSSLKWIAYDEFHRTSNSLCVQDAVLIDQREGRKFKIGVILSSQGAGDFPEVMREFATAVFVMDAGTESNARNLQSFFGFNDTTRRLMSQYATGPTSAGAPLLASITTKKGGTFTQLLVSTLGTTTRWALSTTLEDVQVRQAVCSKLGPIQGRAALTATYPEGAQAAVERLEQAGEANARNLVVNDVLVRWKRAQPLAA